MALRKQSSQSPELLPQSPSPYKRRRLGSTLRSRLILALVAAATIPTAIADVIGARLTQERSRAGSLQQLELTALQAGVLTDDFLAEARVFPKVIAESQLFVEALKTSIQTVDSEGLASLPPAEVDARFAETKVVQDFPNLNQFLQGIVSSSSITEVIVTESRGINVAIGRPTSDVVQRDEAWWQQTQAADGPLVLDPAYDASAGTIAIELTDVIRDPSDGTFLGIIKIGVPSAELLDSLKAFLKEQELALQDEVGATVEDIQLLNTASVAGEPLLTIGGNEDPLQKLKTIGGAPIQQVATYLSRIQDDATVTPENIEAALGRDFGVKPLLVERQNIGDRPTVVALLEADNRVYALSAVPNTPWVTLTSTRKATIAAASRQLQKVFLVTGVLLVSVTAVLAYFLAKQLSDPIDALTVAAQRVAGGDLDTHAEAVGTVETQTLAGSFNNLVAQVKTLLEAQQQEAERDRLFAEVAQAQSAEEVQEPLNRLMADTRQALGADRVVIYRFNPDWSGYIAAEDVLPGWTQALGSTVFDACIPQELIEAYEMGRYVPTENVYTANFHPEHQKLMERLEIKSNLVMPIVSTGGLYGLLVAHHCQDFHSWEQSEIFYLQQVAERVGAALAGLILLDRQGAAAEEQRRQREELEASVVSLMEDIEGAAEGDLTVRAKLLAGDMGIIADLFNAVVENLRDTAQQVKQSAGQVSNSLGDNEGAIRELAEKAISEANEIRDTLGSIETMNQSIREVADNAGQAAVIANDAFTTAREGNSAMEQTVRGVLGLRNTIGETSKKMKRLGESAQKISQVVSLIDEIALKTNLLAINASVEANRAGEMGQGFTAVAQQVGALAEQSAAAAKEIARSISDIQLETQDAIAAMEQGTAEVVDNTRLVETTQQRLADMLEKSQEIDNLMRSISTATTSQAETSQVVATLMQQITEASEARSLSSRQVAEAIQSTAAVAQSLESSVEQFKVEKS